MALHWNQVRWRDNSETNLGPYESGILKLNCDKSLHYLQWHAAMGFEATVRMTSQWYQAFYQQPEKMATITNTQITEYAAIAKERGLGWAI
jgi:CDP-glucose 4,6-dehydratase